MDAFEREVSNNLRLLEGFSKGTAKLLKIAQAFEKSGLPEPDIVTGYVDHVYLRWISADNYRELSAQLRQWLNASESVWRVAYDSQELVTEGEMFDMRVVAQISVGVRPGCRLEYEEVTVTKPKIVCEGDNDEQAGVVSVTEVGS